MSTIAIITVAAGGNVPPARSIGHALKDRGHEVHLFGQEQQRARFEAEGFAFTALASLQFWGERRTATTVPAAVSSAARLAASREIRAEVRATLARLHPDVVLVDALMASAILGSREAGLPTAVLFHTYYEYWMRGLHPGPVGWLSRARGVNMRQAWESADAQLVVCEADFDPASRRQHSANGPVWVGAMSTGAQPTTVDGTSGSAGQSQLNVAAWPDRHVSKHHQRTGVAARPRAGHPGRRCSGS